MVMREKNDKVVIDLFGEKGEEIGENGLRGGVMGDLGEGRGGI